MFEPSTAMGGQPLDDAAVVDLELLTKSELAKAFKVSGRQVEGLVKSGRLPKPIRLGSHPRWRRSELVTFLSQLKPE